MSAGNYGSSGSGNIRCQNCGHIFGSEGVKIGIMAERYNVAQMGQVVAGKLPMREAQAQIKCPQCKQTATETRRY